MFAARRINCGVRKLPCARRYGRVYVRVPGLNLSFTDVVRASKRRLDNAIAYLTDVVQNYRRPDVADDEREWALNWQP